MTVASLLRGTVGRRAFAGHGPNELGAAEAAVLRRWIVVVLACLEYSRSELRVGGENIRVRKRKRSYQFHQRWGANKINPLAKWIVGDEGHTHHTLTKKRRKFAYWRRAFPPRSMCDAGRFHASL